MKPDFSGYATKAGIRCSDGRTITPDAFKHQDGVTVPLVWQHNHDDPENVLGHVLLTHVPDGQRCDAFFNSTPKALVAKSLVEHKDIVALSIFANQLVEKSKSVYHGMIREVSLVLAGANPGALIDNIAIQHGDSIDVLDDEAVIYTGESLQHSDDDSTGTTPDDDSTGTTPDDDSTGTTPDDDSTGTTPDDDSTGTTPDDDSTGTTPDDSASHSDSPTVQEVYDTLNSTQKELVNHLVGSAVEKTQTDMSSISHDTQDQEDGTGMKTKRNVFEDATGGKSADEHVLSHDDVKAIFASAAQKGSLRDAVLDYGIAHGIEDIDVLFPNAVNITDTPEFLSRRVAWVQGVLDSIVKAPISRIKTLLADITFDEARAKGYVKGNLKKEEWFKVSKRTTTPATVYKKQKLDRDDIIDITDFDVVVWLKQEMRLMLDEEIARAALIGDGRDVDDPDKIQDPAGAPEGAGIRSILHDHDLYAPTWTVDDGATNLQVVDAVTSALGLYKGSGSPVFYTTLPQLTQLLLERDSFGHRLWHSRDELATEMGVSAIVDVEVFEDEPDLIGIIVNLRDYRFGTDKGGEVNFFDFFDIDYNQYKFLYETRMSGALTKIRSAIVVKRAPTGSTLVTPEEPDFDGTTVTVKTTPNVTYKNQANDATLTTGAPVTLDPGEELTVYAVPASTYFFTDNVHDQWTFRNDN